MENRIGGRLTLQLKLDRHLHLSIDLPKFLNPNLYLIRFLDFRQLDNEVNPACFARLKDQMYLPLLSWYLPMRCAVLPFSDIVLAKLRNRG